jgi:hypothetical protein
MMTHKLKPKEKTPIAKLFDRASTSSVLSPHELSTDSLAVAKRIGVLGSGRPDWLVNPKPTQLAKRVDTLNPNTTCLWAGQPDMTQLTLLAKANGLCQVDNPPSDPIYFFFQYIFFKIYIYI